MIIKELREKFSKYNIEIIDENNAVDALEVLRNNEYFISKTQNHEPLVQDVIDDILGRPQGLSLEQKTYCIIYKDKQAFALLDYLEKFPNDRSGYIGLFILNSQFHGKGYAKELFDGLSDISKNMNFTEIQLGCMLDNEAGCKFWTKNGFEVFDKVIHNIDNEDFEIYRMIKRL